MIRFTSIVALLLALIVLVSPAKAVAVDDTVTVAVDGGVS